MRIILTESQYDKLAHFNDRYANRIGMIDLRPRDKETIKRRIGDLMRKSFPAGKKIAYRVSQLPPNKDSPQYFFDGQPYYRFTDKEGNLFIGDEIWAIIKNDDFTTFLVRKSNEMKNKQHAKRAFNVDNVLYGENDYENLKKTLAGTYGQ